MSSPEQIDTERPADVEAPDPGSLRLRAYALVAAMAVGSVFLWFGIPVLWVLLGAQFSTPGVPSMAPIALVLIATPVSMVFFAPLLGRLDFAHRRIRQTLRDKPRRATWNESMRAERDKDNDDGVLERVMIISVVVAGALGGGYLAFFGKLTLPG